MLGTGYDVWHFLKFQVSYQDQGMQEEICVLTSTFSVHAVSWKKVIWYVHVMVASMTMSFYLIGAHFKVQGKMAGTQLDSTTMKPC